MVKELLYTEKAATRKQGSWGKRKLTGQGKHTVKVGSHPHAKLVWRLKDKSSVHM